MSLEIKFDNWQRELVDCPRCGKKSCGQFMTNDSGIFEAEFHCQQCGHEYRAKVALNPNPNRGITSLTVK